MGFRKTFSRANMNSVQKACLVIGFIALLLFFFGVFVLGEETLIVTSLVAFPSSILIFYLFNK